MVGLAHLVAASVALAAAWQPPEGRAQVALWPGAPPGARPDKAPESAGPGGSQVAGRPWVAVEHVSRPTLTVFPPRTANTGAAVVVFPGGGYSILAIDLEGTEVCDWLTGRGVTCVLVKYRVPCDKVGPYRECQAALQDAQRALSLVRAHSAEWGVDPHKVGVMGFSAGGHLVAATSTHFEERSYPRVDGADDQSCRPDFAVAVYPGHIAVRETRFALNPALRFSAKTPPTFVVQAQDDPVDPVENALVYYAALKKAGVPAELHAFARGGHAFGVREKSLPVSRWPELVERWLAGLGVLPEAT